MLSDYYDQLALSRAADTIGASRRGIAVAAPPAMPIRRSCGGMAGGRRERVNRIRERPQALTEGGDITVSRLSVASGYERPDRAMSPPPRGWRCPHPCRHFSPYSDGEKGLRLGRYCSLVIGETSTDPLRHYTGRMPAGSEGSRSLSVCVAIKTCRHGVNRHGCRGVM
jgi:hypothetical protein